MTAAFAQHPIVCTKLVPPRRRKLVLPRGRLNARLQEARDYCLTVVQASTGYGKRRAPAAALGDRREHLFWYTITETDNDPTCSSST